jgi:DUF1680 family protein
MGEGCVTVTWIQFNLSLLRITGETKYAEELERSLYNHLLAAENPQTGCVSYYTALQGVKPYRCDQGYSCCLSSVPRGISLIPEMLGGIIDGSFTVLLYENGMAATVISTADSGEVQLYIRSTTKFPMDGLVDFDIEPAKTAVFVIAFRIPEWSADFKAVVDGVTYTGKRGGLLIIRRKWRRGDRVKITFDIPVQVLPGGISYPNAIAIRRGPQVLALDKGLNTGIGPMTTVTYTGSPSLADADGALPADWDWKEAFYLNAKVNDHPQKIVLVPFAEAGQKTAEVAVWMSR